MNKLQKITACVSLVIGLSTICGGAIAFYVNKADRSELQLVSDRLDQKIIDDRIHNLQRRIWALEEHYGGPGVPNAPSEVKKEYQELKIELKSLEDR